jgi:hypothetical protein
VLGALYAPARRPLVPGEIQTDSSFTGWGWVGMGLRRQGPWPTDWMARIGRASEDTPVCARAAWQRIFICELELICCIYAMRVLCGVSRDFRYICALEPHPAWYRCTR